MVQQRKQRRSANWVSVTAPDTTLGIDAQLAVGGSISGTVTDATGAGIPYVAVGVTAVSGNYGAAGLTAADGTYTVNWIPTGSYTINFALEGYYLNGITTKATRAVQTGYR